jgi:hypothetical protein
MSEAGATIREALESAQDMCARATACGVEIDEALAALDALEAERDRYILAHDGPTGSYARAMKAEAHVQAVKRELERYADGESDCLVALGLIGKAVKVI